MYTLTFRKKHIFILFRNYIKEMLLCVLCGGDASTSGTSCVLCNKIIDIKCHGGTVGDGNIICKVCASMQLDENNETVGSGKIVV